MRIGIITLPLHTNYGGILQAYALQTVLERAGHDVRLIEERRRPLRLPLWKAPLSYGKRIVKNLAGRPMPVLYEQKVNREAPVTRQHTDKFIGRYIKRRVVGSFADIREGDFDAIVVGSDQIWRPMYFRGIEHAYLDFAEGWDIRRVAYAASFGTDEWEYTARQTRRCGALLRGFGAVSVREASGVVLCREHFGVEARQVLDPTMLLSPDDWTRVALKPEKVAEGAPFVFKYVLGDNVHNEKIQSIARDMGAKVVDVRDRRLRIGPSEFVWLAAHAAAICTDSFHGCVFALLHHKPLCLFERASKIDMSSRMDTLCDLFGMECCRERSEGFDMYGMDWEAFEARLAHLRSFSQNWLDAALAGDSSHA